MLGPVEELLSHYQQVEKTPARLALETVYRNATRLQKLVNALLDFSRIEAGRMSAQFQHIDLAAYTSELASAFESAMDRAGLRFLVDCVPLSASVPVDTDMWEKIVLNLLSNALKYTLSGEVALRLIEKEGSVELSVSDTGIGIPKAELPHLFERFHRVAGAQGRTYEGTGIGLALIHELVGLHGGAVSVKSELGKGSVFTVSLPLPSPPASLHPASKDTRTHPNSLQANTYVEEALGWLPQNDTPVPFKPYTRQSESLNGRTDRILLVDDNADMRNYLQRLLSTEFEVDVFATGRQALAAATANPPDLIISDIMMPELDGLGLLGELRANSLTRTIPFFSLRQSGRRGKRRRSGGRSRRLYCETLHRPRVAGFRRNQTGKCPRSLGRTAWEASMTHARNRPPNRRPAQRC